MAIIFNCPSCGKHFEVGDGLAGKRVRCKVCAHEMRIPGEPRSLSQPKQPPQSPLLSEPKPKSQTKPSGRSLSRTDPAPAQADVFGFDDIPLPSRGSNLPPTLAQVAAAAQHDPEFSSPWRAPAHMDSHPGKKTGNFDPQVMEPLPRWLSIVVGVFGVLSGIGLVMVIVGAAMSGQTKDVMAGIMFVPAFALMGLSIVHNLKIMCHAARVGVGHLLAYLIVPLYSLIFVIMYWRATKRSFLLQILGIVGFYGFIILGVVIGGGFENDR